jgi:hypothetical protein
MIEMEKLLVLSGMLVGLSLVLLMIDMGLMLPILDNIAL